jgi:hypothetical protein
MGIMIRASERACNKMRMDDSLVSGICQGQVPLRSNGRYVRAGGPRPAAGRRKLCRWPVTVSKRFPKEVNLPSFSSTEQYHAAFTGTGIGIGIF